jgi:arylsulfatase A-like enzyme
MKKNLWLLIISMIVATIGTAQDKPNVLFIAIDDLNDWIGCMKGHPQAKTPNIDRLAAQSTLFTNTHCQAPICGPSRASVMSGLMPTTTGNYLMVKDKEIKLSNEASKNSIFLPDYFEQFGYKTMGTGKLFHNGDSADCFDEYRKETATLYGPLPPKRFKYDPLWFGKPKGTATDWGAFPTDENDMPDTRSADWAVQKLGTKQEKPFFLAVGFVRPHVPWYAPQKWFDMFPINEIQTPPYLKTDMDDVPKLGQRIAAMPTMPTTDWMIETNQWKDAVQAYLACIAYVDAQVGKLLDALEKSPYAKNTVVVLWSDHGQHVGEKNRFGKQALWDRAIKAVLMFKQPGKTANAVCDKPVQLLDIYPTLTALCGLPDNKMNEGHSLMPLINNPSSTIWPHYAVTAYGKGNISIFSQQYQLIQYEDKSMELYDLKSDPNEWKNLAGDKKYKRIIKDHQKHIPAKQVKNSPYSTYWINEYFQNAGK